jgi:hypothetical protein
MRGLRVIEIPDAQVSCSLWPSQRP